MQTDHQQQYGSPNLSEPDPDLLRASVNPPLAPPHSAQPSHLRSRVRKITEVFQRLIPRRTMWLVWGMLAIVIGQAIIEQPDERGWQYSWINDWNNIYRLELTNPQNTAIAILFLLIGAAIFVLVDAGEQSAEPQIKLLGWPKLTQIDWGYAFPRLLTAGILLGFLLFNLSKQTYYYTVFPLCWVIALGCLTLTIWRWECSSGLDLSPRLARADWLWVLALLALGIVVGCYQLRDIPGKLIPDEGAFWESARAFAVQELRVPFFDTGVYTYPVSSSIYQSLVMRLFGINIWGWRFSSVLAGVATVVPLYLFARDWFDRLTAVLAGIALLTSSYFLAYARIGYNNSQSLFLVTLSLYLFSHGLLRSSYVYCWAAGLVAGLGFYTYTAAQLGIVVIIPALLWCLVTRRVGVGQALVIATLMIVGAVVVILPRVFFQSGTPDASLYKLLEPLFNNTFYGLAMFSEQELYRVAPPIEIGDQQLFYEPSLYKILLIRGFVRSLLAFTNPFLIRDHFISSSLTGSIAAVFFITGVATCIRRWKEFGFFICLLWLFLGVLGLSAIHSFPPRDAHLVSIIPVVAILVAVGLVRVTQALGRHLSFLPSTVPVTRVLTFLALAGVAGSGLHQYFVETHRFSPNNLDETIAAVAWRTNPDIALVYIGPSPQESWMDFVTRTQLGPHFYAFLPIESLLAPVPPLPTGQQMIVFLPYDGQRTWVANRLSELAPDLKPMVTLHDQTGLPIGVAMTNTDVDLEPRVGLHTGLGMLLQTPAGWLLGLLALLFLGVLFFGRASRTSS